MSGDKGRKQTNQNVTRVVGSNLPLGDVAHGPDSGANFDPSLFQPFVEHWSIDRLRPNPRSPRTHNRKLILMLAASMQKIGNLVPIVVDENGVILSGNARWAAALTNGWLTVPIIRVDHLNRRPHWMPARSMRCSKRFRDLSSGKTAIIISHRFSTVRMADRILVLDSGRVVEAGSHEDLVAAGGRYAELFELQAAGYR